MIDRETWIILAERLAEIKAARELARELEEDVRLEFDAHDQAKIVKPGGSGGESRGQRSAAARVAPHRR